MAPSFWRLFSGRRFGGCGLDGVLPRQVLGDLPLDLADHAYRALDHVFTRVWVPNRLRRLSIAKSVHSRQTLDGVLKLFLVLNHASEETAVAAGSKQFDGDRATIGELDVDLVITQERGTQKCVTARGEYLYFLLNTVPKHTSLVCFQDNAAAVC